MSNCFITLALDRVTSVGKIRIQERFLHGAFSKHSNILVTNLREQHA